MISSLLFPVGHLMPVSNVGKAKVDAHQGNATHTHTHTHIFFLKKGMVFLIHHKVQNASIYKVPRHFWFPLSLEVGACQIIFVEVKFIAFDSFFLLTWKPSTLLSLHTHTQTKLHTTKYCKSNIALMNNYLKMFGHFNFCRILGSQVPCLQ